MIWDESNPCCQVFVLRRHVVCVTSLVKSQIHPLTIRCTKRTRKKRSGKRPLFENWVFSRSSSAIEQEGHQRTIGPSFVVHLEGNMVSTLCEEHHKARSQLSFVKFSRGEGLHVDLLRTQKLEAVKGRAFPPPKKGGTFPNENAHSLRVVAAGKERQITNRGEESVSEDILHSVAKYSCTYPTYPSLNATRAQTRNTVEKEVYFAHRPMDRVYLDFSDYPPTAYRTFFPRSFCVESIGITTSSPSSSILGDFVWLIPTILNVNSAAALCS